MLDDLVASQAAIATDLEAFDQRITERGWTFDEEESDEEFVFWLYPPSTADVDDGERAPVTTIWMSAEEDAEVVHLMLVGTSDDLSFELDAFLEHLDTIEAYRCGDPAPTFNHS